VYPHLSHSVPRMIPPNQLDGNAPGRTSLDVNLAYDVLGVDISGLSWTPPAPDVSEGKGFEPSVRLHAHGPCGPPDQPLRHPVLVGEVAEEPLPTPGTTRSRARQPAVEAMKVLAPERAEL
jgi:hypothetical protein